METMKICVPKIYPIVQDFSSNMEDLIQRGKKETDFTHIAQYIKNKIHPSFTSLLNREQLHNSEPICYVKCISCLFYKDRMEKSSMLMSSFKWSHLFTSLPAWNIRNWYLLIAPSIKLDKLCHTCGLLELAIKTDNNPAATNFAHRIV